MNALRLYQASSIAPEADLLLIMLTLTSGLVLALVFGLMILYMVRYRVGSPVDRGKIAKKTWRIEIAWTAATLLIFFGLFLWGADLYVREFQPRTGTLKISVIAKQWMWKVEHPGGQREINALHIPVDRPIQLLMTSEDVIHSFFVPAFRLKHDVVPGRYLTMWFRPTRIGTYHLFCTQLCGTDHSAMIGEVVVMSAADYQNWLGRAGAAESLAATGRDLFIHYGCSGCHQAQGHGGNGTVRAPDLDGVYNGPVPLSDGTTVIADDRYIRDSILMPAKQVVASYAPLMPSFAGVITEEDLIRIIAYIKSLGGRGGPE